MIEGVDYSTARPSPARLAAAGKAFAMRYVGPGSAPKHLTAGERDALWAAGLGIVLLAEAGTQDPLGGYNKGVQHGQLARAAADALGAPHDLPVYFAVDWNLTAAQWPTVAAYLHGCAFEMGAPQVGVYGGYNTVAWAARDHVADWFFQTYAWSHGRWYQGNHVEQYHNGVTLAGGDVDLCRAVRADFGQWRRPTIPEEDDMDTQQVHQLEDAWNILLALAAGQDTAKVHDHDGVLSLAGLYTRLAATVVDALPTTPVLEGVTLEEVRAVVVDELARLRLSVGP